MMAQSRFVLGWSGAALLAVLFCGTAHAEVEQQNLTCGQASCIKWWPKVSPPRGWHAETEESKEHGVRMFAPDQKDSNIRFYTYAIRKSDAPKLRTLDDVIARDKDSHGSSKSSEGKRIQLQGDLELRTYLYESSDASDWDRAAYGEEGEFFIIFYLTTNTLETLGKSTYAFEDFVGSYQGKAKSREQKQSKP